VDIEAGQAQSPQNPEKAAPGRQPGDNQYYLPHMNKACMTK
jgi:hypothetical protein